MQISTPLDGGLRINNTWDMSEGDQKSLAKYWKRLEEQLKPQSNYLQNLTQHNRPLDEFLTEAKLLVENRCFPADTIDE